MTATTPTTTTSPTAAPEITAAASTADGHIAPFSAPGASILVTAPGVAVLSTMLVHGDPANAFGFVSGTSFAAPIVSGVVAMMLEANPDSAIATCRKSLRCRRA